MVTYESYHARNLIAPLQIPYNLPTSSDFKSSLCKRPKKRATQFYSETARPLLQ